VSARGPQPSQGDHDEPVDRGGGCQAAGRCEGVQAVARKLVRRDISPNVACISDIGQETSNQLDELVLRSGEVLISMQEFREFGAVLFAVMNDECVGLEHGFEPIAGVTGLVPDLGEVLEVMEPAAWLVLVPLAFASLLTGLIQSLGTTWGLFRHYWVVFKLLLNLMATIVLLTYMETFAVMADVAADPSADLGMVRNASPGLHASLALLVLVVAVVLAVYKPRGMTRYGRRKQRVRALTM
jgi:hypothetical protein